MRALSITAVFALACGSGSPQFASRSGALEQQCDGLWHWVYVEGAVCGDGSQTGFQYICRTGSTAGPLLVYLEGGGACFGGDTCNCPGGDCGAGSATIINNHFGVADSFDGRPWEQSSFGGQL